jgi:hypothetical protein
MKVFIILLALVLPILETTRKEQPDFETQECVILLIQPIACHKCYVEIDKEIRSMKDRSFKYYILLESENRVTRRKAIMNLYKKQYGLTPDDFIFAKDSELYEKFQEDNKLTYSPVLILVKSDTTILYTYSDIFKKEGNLIKEVLGKM